MKTFSLPSAIKLACFILMSLVSTQAMAWWNDAWPYRLPVSVDSTATSGAGLIEAHKNASVLVKLHSGNFEDFFLVKEDLSDIRFVGGDDKLPLKHHVEYFDLLNQLAYIWVQIPEVKANISTGQIWMYYGNAEVVSGSGDSGASYDVDTAAVYHFGDAANPQDSTAYLNHSASFTGASEKAAVIASGARFGSGTNMIINDSPSLAVQAEQGMTVSLWIKPAGSQGDAWLVHRKDGANELILGLEQNSLYAKLNLAGQQYSIAPIAAITPDTWQHISLHIAPQQMRLLVDGRQIAEQAISLTPFGGTIAIGANLEGAQAFNGDIDELRFDKLARSNEWVKLQIASQGLGGRLLALQPGEQLGAGETSFVAVIFASTDEIGWTVVGLLMAMALVSFMVIIAKAIYLARMQKDNAAFLGQYRQMGNQDPALLDHKETVEDKALENSPITQAIFGKHDHYQSSPIYRVYHRAIEEVHHRLGDEAHQSTQLSQSSVAAIKASLQSQMIRESQRMNSQMVLLTIAISGGPFLGLLGTVMGVMITFAAIAASGDVNIAAIAPGVAAALLTTVAGLVVAIPALFGYNWLMTRIKEVTADMRVFTEEFITRVAEHYGHKS